MIEDPDTIKEKAIEDMKKYGPVFAGTPAGDFNVVPVQGMILKHSQRILFYNKIFIL